MVYGDGCIWLKGKYNICLTEGKIKAGKYLFVHAGLAFMTQHVPFKGCLKADLLNAYSVRNWCW